MPTRERESLAQSPDLDARAEAKRRAVPALATYDRAAVGTLSAQRGGGMESPHKAAVIGAIKHKLMVLALQEKESIEAPDALTSTASNVKPRRASADQ